MNGYELSRVWFDFCFENPEVIRPNHTALYFFAIEHCNRLGWKEKFGFPTEMAKEAIGIKNYRTYTNTLNDLVDWGFITMIEKSKNQYSANIIAIVKNTKAPTKALYKARSKHLQKHCMSTYKSIDSIDKQLTIEPNNNKQTNNACASEKEFELSREIADKFSISEITQATQFKQIVALVRHLGSKDELDYLSQQHKYYHKFKDRESEKKHGIKNFIGEYPFIDGAWNECDWKLKFEKNGKSREVLVNEAGYGSL